ncbi:hypothetical protein AALO_G00097830 [Alosa alosa]|uniref:Secreted protein n=1 Tax=Alosa alosa TaxID=278164 RepID=A0AAV6GV14_9TELE|nr:hypothetical protein AALO_G00097830 [Alosa alosa]
MDRAGRNTSLLFSRASWTLRLTASSSYGQHSRPSPCCHHWSIRRQPSAGDMSKLPPDVRHQGGVLLWPDHLPVLWWTLHVRVCPWLLSHPFLC